MDEKKLLIQALVKFFAGVVIIGLLIFLPAGLAAHGYSVCADVLCRTGDDGEESGPSS